MVARFAGASLGLLAFSVTIAAGLYANNPPLVILSRSVFALFTFCVLGILFGVAAQSVIAEYERSRRSKIERTYRDDELSEEDTAVTAGSMDPRTEPGRV